MYYEWRFQRRATLIHCSFYNCYLIFCLQCAKAFTQFLRVLHHWKAQRWLNFKKCLFLKCPKSEHQTLFEILTKFQISYLFQHSCFNHIWVDPNLDHRLPMQQEWNWWQIWNSVIDQKPKPNAKWSIFCLFERLLEFLVAYNSVIWTPQMKTGGVSMPNNSP